MKLKRLICLNLCILAVCTTALTACNGNGAAPDDTDTTATTTSQSTTATEAETTEKDSAASTDAADTPEGGAGNNSGSSTSSKKCIITVGDKDYTAKVGDTVTYSYYLTTPKKIENVQAALSYNSSVLRIESSDTAKMFPVIGSGVVYNTGLSNTVKFNASNISGYDFTQRAQLITVEFKVLSRGSTTVATAIEIMDEKGGKPYVSNFKISGDVTCEEVLKQ